MLAELRADEHWIEEVVDAADDECSPDCKKSSLAPKAGEAEVDGDGDPDETGAHGRESD